MKQLDESIARYLAELDRADRDTRGVNGSRGEVRRYDRFWPYSV
jgi:hypothetical protein